MSDSVVDVAVAGAGPVGLTLALGLARRRRSVVVLESQPDLDVHSRAPAVWPRTLEVIDRLDTVERLVARGIVVPRLTFWDADEDPPQPLLELPVDELSGETRFPFLLIVPQSETERVLLDALRECETATVRFGAEVLDFEEHDETVVVRFREDGAERTVRARLLAGCDGAHSRVRERLGLRLEGYTYPICAALADVDVGGPPSDRFPLVSTAHGPVIAIRIDGVRWRLILPYPAGESLDLDARLRSVLPALFDDRATRVTWTSHFALHQRIAPQFARGRVVLAGDAAHLNSPVGGQGLNLGVQEAERLARVLIRALDQDSPYPLGAYERVHRREIRTGVNRFTDTLTRVVAAGDGRHVKRLLHGAAWMLTVPAWRHRVLRKLAMLPPLG